MIHDGMPALAAAAADSARMCEARPRRYRRGSFHDSQAMWCGGVVVAHRLERYVAPLDEPVPLDQDGFLVATGRSRVVPVVDLPSVSRNFALLAAGGAGKTTTTKALARVERGARYTETPLERQDKLERMISEAASAGTPLYFDSLDEAVARDPFIMRWLARELAESDATDGHWRFSCRSAAWDPNLADSLPDCRTWKLLPLDRATAVAVVEEAVGSSSFDGAAFVTAVAAAGLGRLSGCVSQLIAVARFWDDRGVLPETAVEAMEYEVAHLLQETNSQRRRNLPVDRAMRIARRLAAVEMFSGTQAFASAASTAPGTLAVDQLPSEPEPVEPARPIEPDDYRHVLDTALFDAGPAGAVVFRHQSYVEYSAATYLVDRGLHPGQVPALLGVHANGLLPAARLGVAVWLGALQPRLIENLIHANALMLASAGTATEFPSDAVRRAVVAALLEQAATGEIETDWRVDPALLVHPNLEAVLAQSLLTLQRPQQVWWIARLAAAGGCTGLAAALAEAAADARWHTTARRAAVEAVAELGDDRIVVGLASILDQDTDPDHEMRAAVIDVLYPKHMSTQALMAALRPRSRLIGGYLYALSELAGRIPPTDLPVALDWLRKVDSETAVRLYEGLVEGLLRQAWEHCDDTDVRQALARLLVSARWDLHSWRMHGFPWAHGEPTRRRGLILEVAQISEDSWPTILMSELLQPDDIEWMLDVADTCSASTAASLAECMARTALGGLTATLADRLLGLQPDHPYYEATRFLRGSTDLSSEVAQLEQRRARSRNEVAESQANDQMQAKVALVDAFARLDEDPGSWWQILVWVDQLSIDSPRSLSNHDLTAWPGWSELQPDDAVKLIDAGVRYLHVHTPDPTAWIPLTSWTLEQTLPDWSGVYLLATLVGHHPDKLAAVRTDTWRRWLSAIVAVPIFSGDDPQGLRGSLLGAVPPELRPALADEAVKHLAALHAAGSSLSPVDVYERLIPEFTDTVVAWLLGLVQASPTADEVLNLVVHSVTADIALDLCRRLRDEPGSPLADRARELLPALDPNSAIDELAGTDCTPAEIARVATRINSAGLDHDHLLLAARLVLDAFPYQSDLPMRNGAWRPEDRAQALRADLLSQLASAGRVDDLASLLGNRDVTTLEVLGRCLAAARARQADLATRNVSPQALLDLLRSGEARLVRDDGDFQSVILLQLDYLQHQIRHTSAFREIWDGTQPQSEDSISDWVKRRLDDRFGQGVIVDREVQVNRPRPKGIGTRIDCVATTVTTAGNTTRVLFEAKLVNNPEVLTAMNDQLISRYLVPEARRHGILLIYWIHPARRPQSWSKILHSDKEALRVTLQEQADMALSSGFHVVPVILDITPPEGFAGKTDSKSPS